MITGLDHVAIVVRDFAAAVEGYMRLLGVAPNWIGEGGGVRQAWFQFPNMALDLISPQGEGQFADVIRAHTDAHGEGQWAVAFTAQDLESFAALLTRRGIKATAPGVSSAIRKLYLLRRFRSRSRPESTGLVLNSSSVR